MIESFVFDQAVLEAVSQTTVTAIYAYFAVVIGVGLYLHGRVWAGYRRQSEPK